MCPHQTCNTMWFRRKLCECFRKQTVPKLNMTVVLNQLYLNKRWCLLFESCFGNKLENRVCLTFSFAITVVYVYLREWFFSNRMREKSTFDIEYGHVKHLFILDPYTDPFNSVCTNFYFVLFVHMHNTYWYESALQSNTKIHTQYIGGGKGINLQLNRSSPSH